MQIKITVLPKHGEVPKEFICQFLATALKMDFEECRRLQLSDGSVSVFVYDYNTFYKLKRLGERYSSFLEIHIEKNLTPEELFKLSFKFIKGNIEFSFKWSSLVFVTALFSFSSYQIISVISSFIQNFIQNIFSIFFAKFFKNSEYPEEDFKKVNLSDAFRCCSSNAFGLILGMLAFWLILGFLFSVVILLLKEVGLILSGLGILWFLYAYPFIIGLASKESGFSYGFFAPFKVIFSFSKTFSASYIKIGTYWLLASTFAIVGGVLLAVTIVGIPLALMVFLWLTIYSGGLAYLSLKAFENERDT